MADCIKLIERSSNKITVTLWDESKQPVTDSVVNLTIVDQNQEIVGGVAFPQPMDNQGNGVYEVILPGDLEIVRTENYWAQIASASPTNGDLYQEVLCKCLVLRS
jgi:hypothetical protein